MSDSRKPAGAIFDAALELPEQERAAYIQQACASDAQLRQRVEALLRAHEGAGTFMDSPALPPMPDTLVVKPAEQAGDKIGRYKLLQSIGEGGCGVVYMAEQEQPVRRRVALKVIKLGMDTKQVVARFEAERQALAMMDHPNIAKVLDGGSTETGGPYFVMELVRGIKLTDYCDQNNLSTRQRLDLFIPVCQAIQHAHQKGIIHRDIKPSNILVTMHDGVPVPKVIDFGIAKATEGRLTDQTLFTAFEQFIGTPAYMSPEQAEMSGLDIDTRSDIYSLGVLLYELLTGKTPFETRDLLEVGLDELRRTIREKEPVRPSTRLLTMLEGELTTTAKRRSVEVPKLISALRDDLDWIVMKALEKDRTRRYETANALAMDIQRHLQNEPVMARPPSRTYRLRKLVRRNRLAFAAGASVAGALVLGIFASAWQAVRAASESTRAKSNEQIARIAHQNEAKQRQAAESRARELRRNVYVTDMSAAFQAIQENGSDRARLLVQKYLDRQPDEEDLRGFEWRYLWEASRIDRQKMLWTNDEGTTCTVFSPDGKLLAVGGGTNLAVVDVASKGLITNLSGFDGTIDFHAVTFSPDGRLLAAKSSTKSRGTISVWRTEDWHERFHWTNGYANYNISDTVVISPHNTTLAARIQGAVGFWDLRTGKQLHELTLPGNPAEELGTRLGTVMAYSADGRLLAIAEENHLQLRDARSLTLVTNLIRQDFISGDSFDKAIRVLSVAFSPTHLAAGYRDGELRLWDLRTWQEVARCKAHSSSLISLDFSSNAETLATAGDDADIGLWNVVSLMGSRFLNGDARPDLVLRGHNGTVSSVMFSPDGQALASGSSDGIVRLWDIPHRADPITVRNSNQFVWISNDGKRLVTGSYSNEPCVWDASAAVKSWRLKVPGLLGPDLHSSIAVSPDFKTLAAGKSDGAIELWDIDKGIRTEPFPRDESWAWQIAFSPDGRSLITGHDRGGIKIRNLLGGKKLLREHKNLVLPFALSPDGKLLAAPREDRKEVEVWDLSEHQRVRAIAQSTAGRGPGAFSPDGRLLAWQDVVPGRLNIWNLASGGVTNVLHRDPGFTSLTFAADGRTLVAATYDGFVLFWNTANWLEMLRVTTYQHPIAFGFAAFSANGEWLALRGYCRRDDTRNVVLWHAPPLAEIDALEAADRDKRPSHR